MDRENRPDAPDDAVRPPRNDEKASAELLTDAALQPDDPVEGEAARQGADPDLVADPRGEEP